MISKEKKQEIIKEYSKYLSENYIRIFTTIINDFIIFIIGIYFVTQINSLLVLVIIPLGIISSLVSKITLQKLTSLQNENKTSNIELFKAFSEGLNAIFVIRNLGYENRYKLLLTSTNNKLRNNEIKQAKYNALRDSIMSALFMTTIGIVMIFLSYLTYNSYISVGGLTAMLMYNHMLVDPLLEIFEEQGNIVKLKISQKRIKNVLLLKENRIDKDFTKADELIIKNLSFNYGEKEILKNINITLKSGEKLIVTGETGCGKSTLANIIAGFITPKSGSVVFKYKDRATENNPKVNYMIQNGYLFDASLFDNLKIANESLTKDEFIKIVNICKLEKVYEQHLNAPIGENGNKLSAGERKRVQIARNIVNSSADIYIFDELTANLDSEIADIVFVNVLNFLQNKICIFIEHDKSKIDLCDYHLSL